MEVPAIIEVPLAILAPWTLPNTVGECRLQSVKVDSGNIHAFVHHQTSKSLAHPLPHDACFTMVYRESFLHHGRADMIVETHGDALEIASTRKRKIVRIACVGRGCGA